MEKSIMEKGDHIFVQRYYPFKFTHHGIYCGNNEVIHFFKNKGEAIILKTTLSEFAKGEKVEIYHQNAKYSAGEIVRRAESKLGEENYNVLFNNCEQFANWCRTGIHESKQAENTSSKGLGGVAGGATTSVITGAIASAAAAGAGNLAGYAGMASAVSSLGLGGVTTAIAGGMGTSVSGAAATAVVTSAVGGPVIAGAILTGGIGIAAGIAVCGLWKVGKAFILNKKSETKSEN